MQQNRALVILGIIAVVVIGFAIWKSPATPAPSTNSVSFPSEGYVEDEKYYDIEAHYPDKTPLMGIADAQARSLMYGYVRDTIGQFKSAGRFDSLTESDIRLMGYDDGRKQALQINYTSASSTRTVSYIFTIYQDTLGAHGNTYFKTFVFDMKTGKELSLANVFTQGSSYLSTLSSVSRNKLQTLLGGDDTSMIVDGTKPDAVNFDNFYFDKKQFVLLFPPYQVAAYAAGPQIVRISSSELPLKPEYR